MARTGAPVKIWPQSKAEVWLQCRTRAQSRSQASTARCQRCLPGRGARGRMITGKGRSPLNTSLAVIGRMFSVHTWCEGYHTSWIFCGTSLNLSQLEPCMYVCMYFFLLKLFVVGGRVGQCSSHQCQLSRSLTCQLRRSQH